jgi:hypothetical protein
VSAQTKLTKLVGFHADAEMQATIYRRAAEVAEGNASAYLRRLAVADITAAGSRPTGVQSDIIARLGLLYRPRIAVGLADLLTRAQIDQPLLLERLLLELFNALAAGHPAAEIHLVDTPHVTPFVPPVGTLLPVAEISEAKKHLTAAARTAARTDARAVRKPQR